MNEARAAAPGNMAAVRFVAEAEAWQSHFEQAAPDGAHHPPLHAHLGARHALDDRPHGRCISRPAQAANGRLASHLGNEAHDAGLSRDLGAC